MDKLTIVKKVVKPIEVSEEFKATKEEMVRLHTPFVLDRQTVEAFYGNWTDSKTRKQKDRFYGSRY